MTRLQSASDCPISYRRWRSNGDTQEHPAQKRPGCAIDRLPTEYQMAVRLYYWLEVGKLCGLRFRKATLDIP
jgi:hypothetical protein